MSEAHNYTEKCTCKLCTVTTPLCQKIISLLTDEKDKKNFEDLICDLVTAETDAIYWKDKFYGTWPSDT